MSRLLNTLGVLAVAFACGIIGYPLILAASPTERRRYEESWLS